LESSLVSPETKHSN